MVPFLLRERIPDMTHRIVVLKPNSKSNPMGSTIDEYTRSLTQRINPTDAFARAALRRYAYASWTLAQLWELQTSLLCSGSSDARQTPSEAALEALNGRVATLEKICADALTWVELSAGALSAAAYPTSAAASAEGLDDPDPSTVLARSTASGGTPSNVIEFPARPQKSRSPRRKASVERPDPAA